MRSIAIIGAGQTALLAAHALHQQGYEVRLYADKSPADFLTRARPTGAAFRAKMVEGGRKLEARSFIGVSLCGRSQTWMREE